MRIYPKFTISKKSEKTIRAGHRWVYGDEVLSVEGDYRSGDIADVVSQSGK
jgi:23S rRNA (cytosine1962-C5)-methyltransferase